MLPSENLLKPEAQYTMFHPSEVEMGTTTQMILAAIEERKPSRVVLDSLSELQLLANPCATDARCWPSNSFLPAVPVP